jgi:hypothetical protein
MFFYGIYGVFYGTYGKVMKVLAVSFDEDCSPEHGCGHDQGGPKDGIEKDELTYSCAEDVDIFFDDGYI